MKEREQTEPVLDKPGAGLPFFEWLFLRLIAPRTAARSDWDENWKLFDKSNQKIFSLIEGLSKEQLGQRVLIPRLRGLEDSSRYWSAAMVLEHLIIVGTSQRMIIQSLAKGKIPQQKASTASVKPVGKKDPLQQVEDYRYFISTLCPTLDPLREEAKSNTLKFAHPWFGPFTMLQWQWMYQAHTHVHRAQLQEIVSRL